MRQYTWNVKSCFLGKNSINFSSAELAKSVIKAKSPPLKVKSRKTAHAKARLRMRSEHTPRQVMSWKNSFIKFIMEQSEPNFDYNLFNNIDWF